MVPENTANTGISNTTLGNAQAQPMRLCGSGTCGPHSRKFQSIGSRAVFHVQHAAGATRRLSVFVTPGPISTRNCWVVGGILLCPFTDLGTCPEVVPTSYVLDGYQPISNVPSEPYSATLASGTFSRSPIKFPEMIQHARRVVGERYTECLQTYLQYTTRLR